MEDPQQDRVQEIANALSNLQLNHQTEQQRSEFLTNEIASLKIDLNSIKLTLQDVTQRLLSFHHQLSTFQIPVPAPPPPPPPHPAFSDVSLMSHASLSGNPKEINQFIYFVKDHLIETESRFLNEKSKINWVVRHFRYHNDSTSRIPPSYNWWMSILKENARLQELDTKSVSAEDPYILPCLVSIRSFLARLEEVFADRSSAEDAKRVLYNCKQGNQPLDVFNSLFSSLVFAVDLTEESRIDVYKASLNPKILEVAIQKDSWKAATTLRAKMDLAILASNILDELNTLRSNMSMKRPDFQLVRPPPPPPPPQHPSNSTPMDIDAITASIGFSFSAYRALCVKNKLCQRCQKPYDETHIKNRSCPNTEVAMKDKLDLFSRLSRSDPATTHLTQINLAPALPSIPTGSWDHIGPGSFADMLMYGSDENGNPIDDGEFISSISSVSPPISPPSSHSPSRLVLPIRLLLSNTHSITALALIDSGAGDSFINHNFLPPAMSYNVGADP
ncbi:hypothetical protein PGT21_007046 [Puccinia graminis f. sp. tritici]|uniref:Uncharacterized protein n=1 Tax=Puccinia graminis f. sp. tritici TaxID=56615 RepID=A0A5B0P3Q5_PUCGR|nr:hypothetical protein PGT21_007046 [Puccinia graminis f. sp. tritici]